MTQSADESNWFQAEVNAMHCVTRKQLMKEFASVFFFPDFFGWNLDALDDCMMDLSWLNKTNFRIRVSNFSHLQEKEPDQAIYLRDMLTDIEAYWEVKRQQVKDQYFWFQVNYQ